jgi:hypothetical protein
VRPTQQSSKWIVLVVIIAGLAAMQLSACSDTSSKAAAEEPASVEPIKGTDLNRVTLSAESVERLGIKTATVTTKQSSGGNVRKVIPYASVVYTPNGRAFTYTSPEPRVFVRQFIVVDTIKGREAILSHGPPVGTSVVTVGSQELFGVEYQVEED